MLRQPNVLWYLTVIWLWRLILQLDMGNKSKEKTTETPRKWSERGQGTCKGFTSSMENTCKSSNYGPSHPAWEPDFPFSKCLVTDSEHQFPQVNPVLTPNHLWGPRSSSVRFHETIFFLGSSEFWKLFVYSFFSSWRIVNYLKDKESMEVEFGASEAAIQLVQCLPHKHKELSWSPGHTLSWGQWRCADPDAC